MSDHVCAWAAASPARYRASSSVEGGVEVVEVEPTSPRSAVGVDLDDVEHSLRIASALVGHRDIGPREGAPPGSQ